MNTYIGAPIFTPEDYEKSTIPKITEVASSSQVAWVEKDYNLLKKYPIANQYQTDQCVAFTMAKLLGITHLIDHGEFIQFSASHIYEKYRSNFPNGGMTVTDAFKNASEGVTLVQLYKNKEKNNNATKLAIKDYALRVAEIFKWGDGVPMLLPTGSIDDVASTIEKTGKGVMVWVWGNSKEWNREVPELKDPSLTLYSATVRHSVTAVDYFIYKGKKALLIEDSWGIDSGKDGRRIVTEDFFKKRSYLSAYGTRFKFEVTNEKPTIKITKYLQFGDKDFEVKQLQEYLQKAGYFPANHGTTNLYGSITAQAVLKWQLANNIEDPATLKEYKGYYFGKKSREVINK